MSNLFTNPLGNKTKRTLRHIAKIMQEKHLRNVGGKLRYPIEMK